MSFFDQTLNDAPIIKRPIPIYQIKNEVDDDELEITQLLSEATDHNISEIADLQTLIRETCILFKISDQLSTLQDDSIEVVRSTSDAFLEAAEKTLALNEQDRKKYENLKEAMSRMVKFLRGNANLINMWLSATKRVVSMIAQR